MDFLVFPELHLTGYTMKDEVYNQAEPIPGPSVKKVEKVAREHGLHILFGMPEESEEAAVTGEGGVAALQPPGAGPARPSCAAQPRVKPPRASRERRPS